MKHKGWVVYAIFSPVQRRQLGIYSNRQFAETDAQKYRRALRTAIVEVVWE